MTGILLLHIVPRIRQKSMFRLEAGREKDDFYHKLFDFYYKLTFTTRVPTSPWGLPPRDGRWHAARSKTSPTRPCLSETGRPMLPFFRPDAMQVQTARAQSSKRPVNRRSEHLPSSKSGRGRFQRKRARPASGRRPSARRRGHARGAFVRVCRPSA